MKLFLTGPSCVAKYFIFTLALVTSGYASTSVKNGNVTMAYTDIVYSGGMEPKVERIFNSKSSHNGLFGFGWSSEYEVYGKASVDGSFVIREYGGGAMNRFTPPQAISKEDVERAVNTLADARTKEGLNKEGVDRYKEQLRTDARYRSDEWERLWERGGLQARVIPEGTVFKSNKFGHQTLTKVKSGYVRQFDNGRVETFSEQGRLVRVADKNQNYVNISYGKDGRMATVEDNFNRKIQFKYNQIGKVAQVLGEGGRVANYDYDGNMLVRSKDVDKNTYEYRYTSDGRYNLAEIRYSDKTTLQFTYFPPSKGEGVRTQKDRDGTLTEYAYSDTPANALEYWTSITVKEADGKAISKSRYEYVDRSKPDGERYTYKMVTDLDGDRTETVYNECCGLPLKITKNGEETSFEYDTKGRVTKKMTPTEVTELQYEPRIGKVTKVSKYSKIDSSKEAQTWASFQYDERGNLNFAKNSTGKGVRLVYDANGRIKAMVDQDKRRLEFVYNEQSKPIQIVDPNVGRIDVVYGNGGEVKKVSSSGGRKIAMQVTSAFQNLLDIIRPAGVTLSF